MPTRATHLPHPMRMMLILATVMSLLAMPLPTLAVKGDGVEYDVRALITAVSPGQAIAYQAFFKNEGSSALANMRFDGAAPGATFISADGPCTGTGSTVGCSLGNLAAGAEVTLTFQFAAPTAAGAVTLTGSFSADARQTGPPSASRNVWSLTADTAVLDSAEFFGRWQPAHGSLSFPTVGRSDRQLTNVSAPPVGFAYPATIRHTDDAIVCDGIDQGGFGQTVDLSIADGKSPVNITITYSAASAAGKSPGQVSVVHQRDDGSCSFPPSNCKLNAGFCYDAGWSGGGPNKLLVIRVQLPHNGKAKGF
jgi:hypothetical protein